MWSLQTPWERSKDSLWECLGIYYLWTFWWLFWDITYRWNQKNNTKEPIYKTETDSDVETKLTLTKGEREGEMRRMDLKDTNYIM